MLSMAGSRNGLRTRRVVLSLAAIAAALLLAAAPAAAMRSEKIAPHLCKTVRGGRFVAIPGFPGEKIDRRLLPDIRWMKRRFDVFIIDGYSRDPVHAANGEHPIGLATDIVPNKGRGGTWKEIGELAHLAEPRQDQPVMPWRWVGWNGDAGHGRGNHLHLSWSHSDTKPKDPARTVYTRICPGHKSDGDGGGGGGGDAGDGSGGVDPGSGDGGSGGIGAKRSTGTSSQIGTLAPIVIEQY